MIFVPFNQINKNKAKYTIITRMLLNYINKLLECV